MIHPMELIKKINNYILDCQKVNLSGTLPLSLSKQGKFKLAQFINIKNDYDVISYNLIEEDKLEIFTYKEDYHNGSYYDKETHTYYIVGEIRDIILEDLKDQYNKIEFCKIEKQIEEERVQSIKNKIIPAEERFV